MNTLMIIAQCCNPIVSPQNPIIEKGANDCNVLIAAIVCLSLVIIAIVAAITLSVWHKKEIAKAGQEAEQKRTKEKEDRVFNLKADYQSKVLDYMKCEIESYNQIPKLLHELKKIEKVIESFKEDDIDFGDLKKQFQELCCYVDSQTKLWDNLVNMDEKRFENDTYIKEIRSYMDNLTISNNDSKTS